MELRVANESALPRLSVSELLKLYPCTVSVFMRHRMACVGCAIAAFHTVNEAAAVYGIEPLEFTQELVSEIQSKEA